MQSPLSFVSRLWSNWITLLGAIMTTCAGLAIVALIAVEFVSSNPNPYASTILFLALPGVFAAGLAIIPVGLWIDRRARRHAGAAFKPNPVLESLRQMMGNSAARRLIAFFAIATVVNVIIFSVGGQTAVHKMDSAQFCGTTCHVMQPEWTAYSNSRHSRVACVQCHIGPGASWAVKAKVNGLKQVWGVMTGNYDRPIPTPVEHLRPSRDTCEQCHWPERFSGNKVVSLPHFKDDTANTPAYNVMLLRIGGRNAKTHEYEGIHWHVSDAASVEYEVLDAARSKIGKITVRDHGKIVAEYLPPAADAALPVQEKHTMDCVDCHNRPTHVFDESPALAVDHAMAKGELDQKAPHLVSVARALLQTPPADGNYRAALETAYKVFAEPPPAAQVLDQAAATLAEVTAHNLFPDQRVGWGTYKSRIGHKHEGDTGPEIGCFRCHDGEHVKTTPTGAKQALKQSCELCHEQIVASENPATLEPEVRQLLPN